MNRVFQDYEGSIDYLNGLKIKKFSCLNDIDASTGEIDTILLWMQSTNDKWFRIFIDGAYCGVDEYDFNDMESDLDDGIKVMNFDSIVQDLTIKSTIVKSQGLPVIDLTITLENNRKIIFKCDKEEICKLKIIDDNTNNVG